MRHDVRHGNPVMEAEYQANIARIKAAFKAKFGMSIYEPKDGGKGTTNDGNTARRALDEPEWFSEVTGVPVEIIKRANNIWICLRSGLPIDPQKFDRYARDTEAMWKAEFPWFPLPPAVHKVWVHGSEVFEVFPITIRSGLLSEEAAEASNKDVKAIQLDHSRQISMIDRNRDTFMWMMCRSSWQILSQLDEKKVKNRKRAPAYPKDVLDMCYDAEQLMDLHGLDANY